MFPRMIRKFSTVKNLKCKINFSELKFESKVPQKPYVPPQINENKESNKISIDETTIHLLERLSLVDLDSKEALKTLNDSIEFASKILTIDTSNTVPLYTVLEDRSLELREDFVTDGNIRDDVIKNAKLLEEEYFVAPPGNIALEQEKKEFN